MKLVFLLEERSMKAVLDVILPKILPNNVEFTTIPHEGKNDLKKSIPIKLRAWNEANVKFVIVHDQDEKDCIELKNELINICSGYNREFIVRIVCHELEAWYWGDMAAIEKAYGMDLKKIKNKRKYSNPDTIANPKYELKSIVKNHQQISGAKKIAAHMDVSVNKSKSFQVFMDGVLRLCN